MNEDTRKKALDVVAEVYTERMRQVEKEGWTPEHDDQHVKGELARAAACYACPAFRVSGRPDSLPMGWPWSGEWWKSTTRRRDLIKAAALIIAEIERLDRESTTQTKTTSA